MGYWGHGIMDGDQALNCLDTILDLLDPPFNNCMDPADITAEALQSKSEEIVAKIKTMDEPHVGFMVLGQMAVTAKANLSLEHRRMILEAIQKELVLTDSDGWRDPHERKMHVRRLATELGLGGPMADDIQYIKLKMLYDQVQDRITGAIQRMPGKNTLPGALLTAITSIQSRDDLKSWSVIAHELREMIGLLSNTELEDLPVSDLTGTALRSVMDTWKKSNESS